MGAITDRLRRSVVRAALAEHERSHDDPAPAQYGVYRPGPEPIRILLFAGSSIGVGLLRQRAEALAQELATRTGKGVGVDVVALQRSVGKPAESALTARRLWRYDALLLVPTPGEVPSIGSTGGWSDELRDLLVLVTGSAASAAPVLLLAVEPASAVAGRSADRLVTALRRAVAGLAVEVLGSPSGASADADERFATVLARALLPRFASTEFRDSLQRMQQLRNAPDPEDERMRALVDSRVLDQRSDDWFDALAATAARSLGTRCAEVNVITDDLQWKLAAVGGDPSDGPRGTSICTMTIQKSGLTVIPDTLTDPRLRGNPLVEREGGIRFYAGFPVESVDGYRIGAVCVYDSEPRKTAEADWSALRDFALAVQHRLQRLEARRQPALAAG